MAQPGDAPILIPICHQTTSIQLPITHHFFHACLIQEGQREARAPKEQTNSGGNGGVTGGYGEILADSKRGILFKKVHDVQYAWEACLCLKRNSGGGVDRVGLGRN